MTFSKTLLTAKALLAGILTTLVCSALLPSCHLPDKPVSQKEALDLAGRIERSVTTGNEAFLNDIFEQKRFAQRVLDAAHQRFNFTLAKEAQTAITEARWGHQVVSAVRGGGSYALVHQYEKDGRQHLLFRLFEGSSAINYHDFELVKTDNGVKALDVYVYMSGEELSKTLAESLVLMTDKLADMTPDDQQKILHIRKINELIEGGNPEDAGGYYDQLPVDLKKQKLFQLIHLRIAQKLGDTAYLAALNEYKTDFPQDPNLGLLMLDAYVMEKDYSSALGAVNRLDTALHKDPFLDYYRGLIYKLMEDPTQSRICLEQLHNSMPRFGKGVVELLANYVNAGYPDSGAMLVREAQADSNITTEQIRALETAYPTIQKYLK
jgi:tetratricopeptide (TPR) repeat protein